MFELDILYCFTCPQVSAKLAHAAHQRENQELCLIVLFVRLLLPIIMPHFPVSLHTIHLRTHYLQIIFRWCSGDLPVDSSLLVFGDFFFQSADWVTKLGIEILKCEQFWEIQNVSPSSNRYLRLNTPVSAVWAKNDSKIYKWSAF